MRDNVGMTCICPRLAVAIWLASVAVVGMLLVLAIGMPALVEVLRHLPDIGSRIALWIQQVGAQLFPNGGL